MSPRIAERIKEALAAETCSGLLNSDVIGRCMGQRLCVPQANLQTDLGANLTAG
jgi:hypothetical protein